MRLAPGQTIEACVASERADKMPGTPVDGATKQLAGLRAFVEEKKLVTIPGIGAGTGCRIAAP